MKKNRIVFSVLPPRPYIILFQKGSILLKKSLVIISSFNFQELLYLLAILKEKSNSHLFMGSQLAISDQSSSSTYPPNTTTDIRPRKIDKQYQKRYLMLTTKAISSKCLSSSKRTLRSWPTRQPKMMSKKTSIVFLRNLLK